ncbi:hypothetical protein KVT40_008371 [Elsinoe batatas]|uniref:Uncharacterized protein n=1 Tax=Elsinoe batatas TaxID=2601811 RepID=A0A8K0KWV0_9PEZI|nr:hypothetical protein KVT40_008371 [Elsinoe batatas]
MSITRGNSDEGMLVGISPKIDVIPRSGYTPSSRSSFTDGSSYDDSNITTVSISTGSNQSPSPLFPRPSSMYASHRLQQDHPSDDRRWDSQSIPYREQSTGWPLVQDANIGDRGFRHLNGPQPYATKQAASGPSTNRGDPVENTYTRRRSLLPSPTSPLNPRSRILPPPPGLANKHHPPSIPSARPHLSERPFSTTHTRPYRRIFRRPSPGTSLKDCRGLDSGQRGLPHLYPEPL